MSESQRHIEIANIVGSGNIDREVDLAEVARSPEFFESKWIEDVEHSRRRGNRLNIRFTRNDTLGILAPTGVTTITGAKSFEILFESNDDLISALTHAGVVGEDIEDGFAVRNIVCVGDLGQDLNLDLLTTGLGIQNVEYEPEQFPGLTYRPEEHNCTMLIFSTGKVVLTGLQNLQTGRRALADFISKLENMGCNQSK